MWCQHIYNTMGYIWNTHWITDSLQAPGVMPGNYDIGFTKEILGCAGASCTLPLYVLTLNLTSLMGLYPQSGVPSIKDNQLHHLASQHQRQVIAQPSFRPQYSQPCAPFLARIPHHDTTNANNLQLEHLRQVIPSWYR
jgi:hypothetical protein